jgi:hypothetical protein
MTTSPVPSTAASSKASPLPHAAAADPSLPSPHIIPPASKTAVSYDIWHKTVTTTSPTSIQAVRTGVLDASPGNVVEHLASSPGSLLPPPPPGAGAAGGLPETFVRRVSKTGETGCVLLAFRPIFVKGAAR